MKFDKFTHVEGNSCGIIQLFGLSTCIWCKKTKEYMDSKGVEYYYVFVDLLDESEKEEAKKLIKKWNSDVSYPTIIINEDRAVIGFDEEEIDREIAGDE